MKTRITLAALAVALYVVIVYAVVVSGDPGPTPGDRAAFEADAQRTNELVVTTGNGSAAISPVAVALSTCEVPVRELTLRTPTLDDVFLELTGTHIEQDEQEEVAGLDRSSERTAARIAEPSAHAADLLDFGVRSRVPVAVVSNNADAAVREFFGVHGWMPRVGSFACRTLENVRQMKPDPYLLLAACTALGIRPARSVFVGDSVSDVTAGHACDMPVIGIAKNAQRAVDLIDAGAHAVVHLGDRAALLG
jgi:phosphoglycolate phosphatase-like HAD superfamily hydrolase